MLFVTVTMNSADAQPGYLGRKQLIELQSSFSPVISLRTIKKPQFDFSVKYERVSSENASWCYSLSFGSYSLNSSELNIYRFEDFLNYSEFGSNKSAYVPVGSMNYKFQEIAVQRRWYFSQLGSLAPYGVYFGLETIVSRAVQTTGDLMFKKMYSSGNETQSFNPVESRRHSAVSETMVFGNRRMLSPNLAIGAQLSMGYILWQSSIPSIATSASAFDNHMDLQEHLMMRHLGASKLVRMGIFASYLF